MVKRLVALAVLVAGLSWAMPVQPVVADPGELDVDAIVEAVPGATVTTYDLTKREDLVALLALLFGWDLPVPLEVEAGVAD